MTGESNPAIWVMHYGRGDEAADIFDHGHIALGWDSLGDFRLLTTEEAVREKLDEYYHGRASNVLTMWARQILGFTFEMKVGDIVVYPRTQDGEVRLGRITGPYSYALDRKRFKSERQVAWKKVIQRTEFSSEALNEFAHQASAYRVEEVTQEVLRIYGPVSQDSEVQRLQEVLNIYSGKGNEGQGIRIAVDERIAIEQYAMHTAEQYYRGQGWDVDAEVHKSNPYDLLCTRPGGDVLYVEVKGTTSPGIKIFLTQGEVEHVTENTNSALFILANIVLTPSPSGAPLASGGEMRVIEPWRLDKTQLTPLAYQYTVSASADAG